MRFPSELVNQAEIARKVDAVAKGLAPDVVRIRFSIDQDWSGDWSIFFRIVLSDRASREARLSETTERATARLSEELNLAESDLFAYFNFRSQSEQAVLREKEWT